MEEITQTDSLEKRWEKANECFNNSDKAGALFLLKSLASDGVLAAFREIGNIYELGGGGVDVDIEKALYWYKKSLDEANDAFGAYGLGRLYFRGNGIEKDYKKALWYFELALENNIEIASLMLARIFNSGLGIEKNIDKAENYYLKAIESGYVYALKELGTLEIKKGNIYKGLKLYSHGIVNHALLLVLNKHDKRLRSV